MPLRRRRSGSRPAGRFRPLEGPLELWRSPAFARSGIDPAGPERLRRFHAHYGEDVLDAARRGEAVTVAEPARGRDAWHPYVTSTRVGNWIAAFSLRPALAAAAAIESLRAQLAYLERNVEDEILGNHVIRNARALVLGGHAFGDERLLDRGRRLLERELPDQVLADGGHYERSPVYHLVVLRDLLELLAAGETWLAEPVERMRTFAAALTRPDGRPALFNDGGQDLAPQLELSVPPAGLSAFPETGYAVWSGDGIWLAFDCGPPSPDFLPAHAHADALSLQLWWDGRPLLVDPGTFTYEPGPDRDWFRSTRAHSTVAVDGRDQFRLWGAFRSGPLPRVDLLEASEATLAAAVEHDGVRHERRITRGTGELEIHDRVEGRGRRLVESRLVWAPGPPVVEVEPTAVDEPSWLAERFYERVATRASVRRAQAVLPFEDGWVIRFAR